VSLRDQVQAQLPGVLADLKALVEIESVSADPSRAANVEHSASCNSWRIWTAQMSG
jgi:acetylornithine deacetylase/succinyl-diaminopimelate desuccinylase-like protein